LALQELMAHRSKTTGGVAYLAVLAAVAAVGGALFIAVRTHKGQEARAIEIPQLSTFYPEPDFLLKHAAELKLSVSQKRHIEIAQREWSMKKAGYNQRLRSYGSDTEGALATLKSHRIPPGDEGKAVLDFDAGRSRAWSNATKPLDPKQVEKLDKLREAAEHPKTSFAEKENGYVARESIRPNSEDMLAEIERDYEAKGKPWIEYKRSPKGFATPPTSSQLLPIPTTPISIHPQVIPLWKGEPPAHLIAPKLAQKQESRSAKSEAVVR